MDINDNATMISNVSTEDPFYVNTHPWTKHSSTIFISMSFLLGIPGNTLVVLVHFNMKEKNPTDWMIFAIALCDILSLFNAPLTVCQIEGFWALGVPNIICKYHYFNLHSVSMASYICCGLTAVQRYCKVVLSKDVFSTKTARFVWLVIFLFSFGLGSPVILTVQNNQNGQCVVDKDDTFLVTIVFMYVLTIALGSSIIMTCCYARIGIYLMVKMKMRKHSVRCNSSFTNSFKTIVQTTKMLGIVTVVFLLTANAPYTAIVGTLLSSKQTTTLKEPFISFMLFVSILPFFNNVFNPFLYMAMSYSFRQRSLCFFRKCCWM